MDNRRGRRWGEPPRAGAAAIANEDDDALQALLGDANTREEEKKRTADRDSRRNHRARRPNDIGDGGYNKRRSTRKNEQDDDDAGYYGRAPGDARTTPKRVVEEDEEPLERKKRRWNDEGNREGEGGEEPESPAENPRKQKADFGLSGALANDARTGNVFNGVTLKFQEPAEARVPNTRWRLYVFRKKKDVVESKGDDLLDTFHISKQSAYLFGRERKVADIPVDHPSLSKQHAVLQYRALPTRSELGGPTKLRCKPFLMDLESTNGTFINGVRLESARYYELKRGDVITLGASSREYVLLTEQSR
mmetsp:Transcript_38887/g.93102  ORF Transcript_38887/g.93102 Transcript_38887/m.93102 type:complete len:306 (-) Transcript_38887:4703-5620(-)